MLPDNEKHKNSENTDVVYYPVGIKYIEIEPIDQILPDGINKITTHDAEGSYHSQKIIWIYLMKIF